MAFIKAKKQALKAKIALEGAAGSGKTFSALLMARGFGGKTAFLDTENSSGLLYANRFDFDHQNLQGSFTPEEYIAMIHEAEEKGYDNLIIDSASHEWDGKNGCLELQSQAGGRYQDWDKITPRHNKFIRAILDSPLNIIICFRSKAGYAMGDKDGKLAVQKVGLKPVTREGFDFECTIVFLLNQSNSAAQTKDRTGMFIGADHIITDQTGKQIKNWLNDGESKLAKILDAFRAATTEQALVDLRNEHKAWMLQNLTKAERGEVGAVYTARMAEIKQDNPGAGDSAPETSETGEKEQPEAPAGSGAPAQNGHEPAQEGQGPAQPESEPEDAPGPQKPRQEQPAEEGQTSLPMHQEQMAPDGFDTIMKKLSGFRKETTLIKYKNDCQESVDKWPPKYREDFSHVFIDALTKIRGTGKTEPAKKNGAITPIKTLEGVPEWVEIGASCDFCLVPGGAPTIIGCKVTEGPFIFKEQACVKVDKVQGPVVISNLQPKV